jgi:YD repeat-containing protein
MRRFVVAREPDARPTLEGREVTRAPVRFYSRMVRGLGVCGLWVGGEPIYNVTVYDADGRPLGTIGSDGLPMRHMYDELRRLLVSEEMRA